MDNPSDEIYQARAEGFITRTRINDVGEDGKSDERYQKSLDTGTNIVSFDQEFSYTWSLFENDERCTILNSRTYGKVCKWDANDKLRLYNVDPIL